VSEPTEAGKTAGVKRQQTYTEFLDNSPMHKTLWFLLLGLVMATALDGMDLMSASFAMPGIIREFKLNPALAGGILSSANVGLAIGAILIPIAADRIGRKPIFQWVLLTFAFGSLLSALAPNYQTLMGARFITGLGLGAENPVCLAMITEYAPRRLRHLLLPAPSLAFGVGFLLAALVSIWLIPAYGWRAVFYAGVVPALLITYVRQYMPESVRFLLSKGRVEEAGAIARKMAERAGVADVELVPPPTAAGEARPGLFQQLAMLKPVWFPTLLLVIFLFCSFIQTFGVTAWLPALFVKQGFTLTRSFGYMLMIMAMAPFSHLIGMWLMARMKRQAAALLMTVISSTFFVLFGLSFAYRWPITVLVGAQVLQALFSQGVVSVVFTFSAEIFPTPVRGVGVGLVGGVGRFGAACGPLVVGVALHWGAQLSHIVYLLAVPLFVIAVVTYCVLKVDPRGRALEEIGAGRPQVAAH
jgi:putative MFS transporter